MSASPPPGFAPSEGVGAFVEHVGPVHVREDREGPVLGLRIEDRHRNAAGSAQGGLLATLVDHALGRAVRAGAEGDARPVTVSLTTDFLGAAEVGDWVEARARVERVGGRLAFADCSLTVDGHEIVRGRGVFAVLR